MLRTTAAPPHALSEGEHVDAVGCLATDGGRTANECGHGNRTEGEVVTGHWSPKNRCKENTRDKSRYARDTL